MFLVSNIKKNSVTTLFLIVIGVVLSWIKTFLSSSSGIYVAENPMPVFEWIASFLGSENCFVLCKIIACIIILLQAILINAFVNQYNLFGFRTFLPGLVFVLITSNFIAYQYLQAILFANIFLMVAWILIAGIYTSSDNIQYIFNSAFALGLSCLFYPTYAYFIILLFAAIMLKSNINLYGFGILMLGFTLVGYFYFSINYIFLDIWQLQGIDIGLESLTIGTLNDITTQQLVLYISFLVIALLLLLNMFNTIHSCKIYVRRNIYLLLVWIFLGIVVMIFTTASSEILYSLAIPASILSSISLVNVKNKWIRESIWILFLILTVLNHYFFNQLLPY